MVVEHGERMAAAAAEQGEVALEVHLPQFVGGLTFEALEGVVRARRRGRAAPRGAECRLRCSAPAPVPLGVRANAPACARPMSCATRAGAGPPPVRLQ